MTKEESVKIENKNTNQLNIRKVFKDIMFILLKLVFIALFFIIIFTFIFGIHISKDGGMKPSITQKDLVIYNRVEKYGVGDVVIVKINDKTQVRRIVAKEGDEIDFSENGMIINGYLQDEREKSQLTLPYTNGISFPIKINSGEYFVLGDSREDAEDSRIYGVVTSENILGKVFTLIRKSNI